MRQMGQPLVRDVVGPGGSMGRIMREPHHGIETEKLLKHRSDDRTKIVNNKKANDGRKHDALRMEFWDRVDIHSLMQKVRNLVEFGLQSADADLEHKRNRLKVQLLEEEAKLTHEYIDRAQQTANRKNEEKKKLAEEIVRRKQAEGLAAAQETYDQLFKASSDEYKSLLFEENKKYCSKINEFQMRDKELAKLKEQEEERMWLEMMRRFEDVTAGGEQKSQLLKESHREVTRVDDILKKQLYGSQRTKQIADQLKLEEKAFWRKMDEIFKEDDEILKQRRTAIKENRKKELLEQMEESKRINDELRRQDSLLDEVFRRQMDTEAARELQAIRDERAQNKKELDIFREALEQIRKSYKLEEEELERLIIEEVRKIERIRKCNRDRLRRAKEDLFQEVVDTREKQMEEAAEKRELEKRERQAIADYRQFRLEQNDQLDRVRSKESEEQYRKYLKDLGEQIEFDRELERREENEMLEWLRSRKDAARLNEQRARKLLNQESGHGSTLHPFVFAFQQGPKKFHS